MVDTSGLWKSKRKRRRSTEDPLLRKRAKRIKEGKGQKEKRNKTNGENESVSHKKKRGPSFGGEKKQEKG